MIEVNGNLSAEDYVRAQYLNMRPKFIFKFLGVLVLAAAFWAMWWVFFGDDDPLVISDLILPGAFVYFVLFFFVFTPWKARRIYKQQKSMHRRLTLRFEESGLAAQNEHGEGITPWPDFLKWKENQHLFLLYVSDYLFIMVPKRILSEPVHEGQIRETLLAKVGRSTA